MSWEKLLIRGSKKVTLTEDGMLLRKRAEEMIDLMETQAGQRGIFAKRLNRTDIFG